MLLSVWEYLRERTRDAVLAGFQDAFDLVEGDDTNASQHDQAMRLVTRLRGSSAALTKTIRIPDASMDGIVATVVTKAPSGNASQKAPEGSQERSGFDHELEDRLKAASPQRGSQSPPSANGRHERNGRHHKKNPPEPPLVTKRGPGRPKKEGNP